MGLHGSDMSDHGVGLWDGAHWMGLHGSDMSDPSHVVSVFVGLHGYRNCGMITITISVHQNEVQLHRESVLPP